MSQQSKPKVTDLLPLKKYVIKWEHCADNEIFTEEHEIVNVYKVTDVESFLEKITRPENLNKLVKSMMFGSKLDLEEILK